jgi:hypothetical protein
MNSHTSGNGAHEADRRPGGPRPRSRPRCNILSVAAPLLGVLAAVIVLGAFGADGHWYWTWRGGVVMGLVAGSCVVGAVLAGIALARSERLWGLTALGLALNVPLPLLLLGQGLVFLGRWLLYG